MVSRYDVWDPETLTIFQQLKILVFLLTKTQGSPCIPILVIVRFCSQDSKTIQETEVKSLPPVLGPGQLPLAARVLNYLDGAPVSCSGNMELRYGGSVSLLILDVQVGSDLSHLPLNVLDILHLHPQSIINLKDQTFRNNSHLRLKSPFELHE